MQPATFNLRAALTERGDTDARARIFFIAFVMVWAVMVVRLFTLQVWQHGMYEALAEGTHEIFREILPRRGTIYLHDGDALFPLAMNRVLFQVYADTRVLKDPKAAAEKIAPLLGMTPDERFQLFLRLEEGKKRNDPFEPIKQRVTKEEKTSLEALAIEGIGFMEQPFRFYPEEEAAAHVTGFFGLGSDGKPAGQYGIEGYFDDELKGAAGFIKGERDALGAWIPLGRRAVQHAKDGADIVLTIDRTLQYELCTMLERHAKEFEAEGAAAVLMDPRTGAVRALCSYPSFDPNRYNEVEGVQVYNNRATFVAYEPGSVFKPIGMAAALDAEVLAPDTKFVDEGYRKFGDFVIRNAANKVYGEQTMTNVLEFSINTGMIFVIESLGKELFREYAHRLGFGKKTGVELNAEVAGDVSALDKPGDIFAATASFGQGITVTPLQLAAAYSAFANKGQMPKPYMVDEIRFTDGSVQKRDPLFERALGERANALLVGMLVSTVENGKMRPARVPGYYVAGKTGTAEIAVAGEYAEGLTNHTFAGFAPAEDPRFVLVVKYEKPKARFADATAAATFGTFAKFLLSYYGVPPTR